MTKVDSGNTKVRVKGKLPEHDCIKVNTNASFLEGKTRYSTIFRKNKKLTFGLACQAIAALSSMDAEFKAIYMALLLFYGEKMEEGRD